MTLQDQIAALPPWADEISLGGCEEDRNYVDLQAALARLDLTRRALQAMVDECLSCGGRGEFEPQGTGDTETCLHCADARRVLEVTK